MKKYLVRIGILIFLATPFVSFAGSTELFLVEYESYEWNPCDSSGMCLAIYCPGGMCITEARQFFVKTLEEVRKIVKNNGTEHLLGMYKIEYDNSSKQTKTIELELVPSFTIGEKNEADR